MGALLEVRTETRLERGGRVTDAQRFYIIAMFMITVKKRQGNIMPNGVMRTLRAVRCLYLNK